MAAPIFSVLMPTHDGADVIGHAIRSVLDQEFGDFELLVVGDGASASTEGVVSSFRDERVRWFDFPKAPHFGYANRNRALRESRGQYIAFVSDDDLILPDHLALMKSLLEDGAALACTRAFWVSVDGIAAPFPVNLELADERSSFLKECNFIPASCFAYRADALATAAEWPEDVMKAGDWHLWQRIIRENEDNPLACSTKPTVIHFSAKRKRSRHSTMPEFKTLLEVHDTTTWWPEVLRPSIPGHMSAQATWAAALIANPKQFTVSVRSAAHVVTDKLAWDGIRSGNTGPLTFATFVRRWLRELRRKRRLRRNI